jgi:protein-L-isoaspartate(D-aspartate) O-methyltransferase
VSIEYDGELAAHAAAHLARAGYPDVQVVTGDGVLGHAHAAAYDRIIVTADATDITSAWLDQLARAGRIAVPIRLHGSGLTRALGMRRTEDHTMVSDSAQVCGFVAMRGRSEQAEQAEQQLARRRQERRARRPVRISLTRISGCSRAAKWPPLSASP